MNKKSKILAIDFDGTCVTYEFPKVGKDIGAVPYLKKLVELDVKLMLWTMRSHDIDSIKHENLKTSTLDEAIHWFTENGIKLWSINRNPEQYKWSKSNKQYANLYLDDAALGAPLTKTNLSSKSYINWTIAGPILLKWAKE